MIAAEGGRLMQAHLMEIRRLRCADYERITCRRDQLRPFEALEPLVAFLPYHLNQPVVGAEHY